TAAAEVGRPVSILADLQGPKLRVGRMENGGVPLETGEEVVLTTRPIVGQRGEVPVQYHDLPQAVEPGDRLLIDDGLLELEVSSTTEEDVVCQVITGGLLQSNKGMNLPRASYSIPVITDKDRDDLRFALEHQVDWVALSFVRQADEVLQLKQMIRERSAFGRPVPVIAKIEKPEAVENIDSIIAAADGIMVARGDLGIETAPEMVPMVQKMIIAHCNTAGKPVITATQMLDSMIRNPRPTRAEASDVANAILDGTDAIMLSGETAVGKYPLLALQTMVRIAQEAEFSQWGRTDRPPRKCGPVSLVAEAVSHASCETASDLKAAAIVTPTISGYTARVISRYRPTSPIVAVTPSPIVQRQLALYWGVYPLLAKRTDNTDEMIVRAVRAAQEHGFAQEGDVVVITAGAAGSAPGTTNLMKVHIIERILVRGQGLGEQVVSGRVRRLEPPITQPTPLEPDAIIVVTHTDRTCVPLVRRAAGLVTEEGETDSHGAILAVDLGIPTVIEAKGATKILSDGQEVTLDARRGVVYVG
ncbi:MAG: pyruvate kinase, partial [Chloroflexota bacterium]|nr:pyruvate kinase [Chloroflexota bacterium]